MSEWQKKRFWKAAKVHEVSGGWAVRLDERSLKTPAKADLILPTRALAEAVAKEWDAQTDGIDPNTMPFTRTANSAVDKVEPQKPQITEMLAEYGASDLLCYRAAHPEALQVRQAESWDSLLAWAADTFDAPLTPTCGVMHQAQPPESLQNLKAEIEALDSFRLAAFHDLVVLSGSLIIALAVLYEKDDVEKLWLAAQIDESWQEETWGHDEEAAEALQIKYKAFSDAALFLRLAHTVS